MRIVTAVAYLSLSLSTSSSTWLRSGVQSGGGPRGGGPRGPPGGNPGPKPRGGGPLKPKFGGGPKPGWGPPNPDINREPINTLPPLVTSRCHVTGCNQTWRSHHWTTHGWGSDHHGRSPHHGRAEWLRRRTVEVWLSHESGSRSRWRAACAAINHTSHAIRANGVGRWIKDLSNSLVFNVRPPRVHDCDATCHWCRLMID